MCHSQLPAREHTIHTHTAIETQRKSRPNVHDSATVNKENVINTKRDIYPRINFVIILSRCNFISVWSYGFGMREWEKRKWNETRNIYNSTTQQSKWARYYDERFFVCVSVCIGFLFVCEPMHNNNSMLNSPYYWTHWMILLMVLFGLHRLIFDSIYKLRGILRQLSIIAAYFGYIKSEIKQVRMKWPITIR